MSDQLVIPVSEIKGGEEIARNIDRLEDSVIAALKAAGQHIEGKVDVYPPETEANHPGRTRTVFFNTKLGEGQIVSFRMPYYIRGEGSVIPTKGGGWKHLLNSQTLGRRWAIGEVTKKDNAYELSIGNNASYAPYVQNRNRQAFFHAKRGWGTTQDVIEQEGENVKEMIGKAITMDWEKRK